uniref:Uncharacterized protein n=1 Tax=Schizaphis graminum TaxID=13262 RepID=A0A2S2PSP9_SCHGA
MNISLNVFNRNGNTFLLFRQLLYLVTLTLICHAVRTYFNILIVQCFIFKYLLYKYNIINEFTCDSDVRANYKFGLFFCRLSPNSCVFLDVLRTTTKMVKADICRQQKRKT